MRVTRLANMAYDYKNKVILITGGAGGIGSHLAREFSAQGARMILLDLDQKRLDSVISDTTLMV